MGQAKGGGEFEMDRVRDDSVLQTNHRQIDPTEGENRRAPTHSLRKYYANLS